MTRSVESLNCPFCAIIHDRGRLQTRMIADWVEIIAFEPLRPVAPGHVLVVPVAHVQDAVEDPDVTAETMRHAAILAATLPPASWNVVTSVGAQATQSVFHLHIHLVPRRPGDGLLLPWSSPSDQAAAQLRHTRLVCPHHGIPDCSPLLNGCRLPEYMINQLDDAARLIEAGEDWGRYRRFR